MPSQYDLQLGRAGEAIKGGLLNFLEGGAPIRAGLAGLLRGDVEPLKQAVGYGQPFPQLTPEQMQQQAFNVAMDINNPMQNVGGLLGITAWHGSPYKFDKFDMSKIGTGAGAQSYGHGLYFSESPNVAKSYSGRLSSELSYNGKPMNRESANNTKDSAAWALYLAEGDKEIAKASGLADPKLIDKLDASKLQPGGQLYKVDIADDAIPKMIDFDKPIGQQSKQVQKAIQNTRSMLPPNAIDDLGGDLSLLYGKDVTPSQFLNTWESLTGSTGSGELALLKQGVPGISYLDRGAQESKKGTKNFVVFDEGLLKILD